MIPILKRFFPTEYIEIPVETIVHVKDPTGLMRNDLEHLKQIFKPPRVGKGVTLEEAKLAEGRYQVIEYIENKMVGGRLNAQLRPRTS